MDGQGPGIVRATAATVLVVEDHPWFREIVATSLVQGGFDVREAASAPAALALLAGTAVDLVVTDVEMPGELDGVDLANWLGATRPGLPVIMMSGHPDADSVAATLAVPRPLLRKPFAMARLLAAVRERLPAHG